MPPHLTRPIRCALLFLATAAPAFAGGAAATNYQDHVRAIFDAHCVSCHDSEIAAGDLDLSGYESTLAGGSSGSVLSSGEPSDSKLLRHLKHEERPYMPPESEPLTPRDIKTIEAWIKSGLKPTASGPAVRTRPPRVAPAPAQPAPPAPPASGLAPLARLSLEPTEVGQRPGAIVALAGHPREALVAVGASRQVFLLSVRDGSLKGVLAFPEGRPRVLQFDRLGRQLLAAGGREARSGQLVVWDLTSGERRFELDAGGDAMLAASLAPDGSQLAWGGADKSVSRRSLRGASAGPPLTKHTGWVRALRYSHDSVLLASGDANGAIWVWETDTGRPFLELRGHEAAITALCWRADSNVLASAGEDGSIRLWRAEDGALLRRWGAHKGGVLDLDFGGGQLISSGRDRKVKLWNQQGKMLASLPTSKDLAPSVRFGSPPRLACAGDFNGALWRYDLTKRASLGQAPLAPPAIATRLESARQNAVSAAKSAARALASSNEADRALVSPRQQLRKLESEDRERAATLSKSEATEAQERRAKARALGLLSQAVDAERAWSATVADVTSAESTASSLKPPLWPWQPDLSSLLQAYSRAGRFQASAARGHLEQELTERTRATAKAAAQRASARRLKEAVSTALARVRSLVANREADAQQARSALRAARAEAKRATLGERRWQLEDGLAKASTERDSILMKRRSSHASLALSSDRAAAIEARARDTRAGLLESQGALKTTVSELGRLAATRPLSKALLARLSKSSEAQRQALELARQIHALVTGGQGHAPAIRAASEAYVERALEALKASRENEARARAFVDLEHRSSARLEATAAALTQRGLELERQLSAARSEQPPARAELAELKKRTAALSEELQAKRAAVSRLRAELTAAGP